ncbi:MAG: FMN-binding protein [Clostridiaceae bacterium]
MKEKNIRYIRYGVQVLGILLTIISFFTNYPIANSVLIGVTLILGPVFCGWICPFGTLQDVFARLGAKLGIKKLVMPAILKKILVFSRYTLLIITILISTDFIFTLLSLDPRANITTLLGGKMLIVAGWIIIFVFLAISMFFERPFCNYLCIEGAKFGVLSTLRPLTIVRNKETCVGCNKCNKACPMNIDISSYGQVRSPQCINCLECIVACPVKNTLKVGLTPVIEPHKKIAVVSIAAAFLIVVYTKINTTSIFKIFTKDNSTSTTTAITGNTAATYGDASGIADGVYTGTGTGFRGSMTVEVTVKSEIITAINVTQHSDDAKWFDRAYSTIASNIISSQTADVDAVSGATYSSMGIKQGVSNALINAGGKNVKTIINDLPAASEKKHGKRK